MTRFVFADLYCEVIKQEAVISAAHNKVPLLSLHPKHLSQDHTVCFAAGFATLAQMRRALIHCRDAVHNFERGNTTMTALLAAIAHADTPLAVLDRIEKWAPASSKGWAPRPQDGGHAIGF